MMFKAEDLLSKDLQGVYYAYEGLIGVGDESRKAGRGWTLYNLECLPIAWPELPYL